MILRNIIYFSFYMNILVMKLKIDIISRFPVSYVLQNIFTIQVKNKAVSIGYRAIEDTEIYYK